MNIFDIMKLGVVIAGCYALFWELMEALRYRSMNRKRTWIKIGFAIMSLYWTLYYLRSLIGVDVGSMHQVLVIAPLMITLMLIGASASQSYLAAQRGKK